jgi:hypothetical protein
MNIAIRFHNAGREHAIGKEYITTRVDTLEASQLRSSQFIVFVF